MLTKVRAVSEHPGLPELVMNITNNPDSDLIQIRNIDGLGPAKANISTSPIGNKTGANFLGTSSDPRNIVLTLAMNPDWVDWTYEKLREKADLYFMDQAKVTLYFETEEKPPVGIVGYVESNEPTLFSKDPETQISIICPDPDFVAETETVLTGLTTDSAIDIQYNGKIATPVYLKVDENVAGVVSQIDTFIRDTFFKVHAAVGAPGLVSGDDFYEMFSMPGSKYARLTGTNILGISGLTQLSLLQYRVANSEWPVLKPGVNSFSVDTDAGVQDWTLKYYERYGSL